MRASGSLAIPVDACVRVRTFIGSRMRSTYLIVVAAGIVSVVPSLARAQISPGQVNPGLIERDVERQQRRLEQREQVPKLQGPGVVAPQRAPAVKIPGGGLRFKLRKVIFDKSKFITLEELDAIASKYVGKQVDVAGLQNLVSEINELYAKRGIVTAIATLPEQTADAGVVRVKLTEGRLQKTSVEGNQHTSKDYILQRVDPPKGEVLDVPQLNRDVVRFNRTNDVQVRALLQPGTDFGLTDLQLAVTEPPRNTLQLFFDNQGVQTTGKIEGGAYYKLHNLAGIDDRFTFYGVKSQGNLNGSIAYNVPVNPWGGRLGVSYTQGKIKIVQGPLAGAEVTGKSNLAAVNFGQPIWVTDTWLLQANGAYAYGNSETDFSSTATVLDRYSKVTGGFALTASGAEYAATIAPAVNSINWHDKILGGERSFDTFTGSANALAKLPAQFSVTFLASWQYTREKLVPGDQLFAIGGPTTVRGYPTNAVAGDSGYYFNFELHRDMSELLKGLDVYAFVDGGSVYATFPARTQLNSSGVGVSWTPTPSFTLEGSVGLPWRSSIPERPREQFYGRVIFRPLLLL